MGWGHCGFDSEGRGIGYCAWAICDHPGCKRLIDRGLDYACGPMHGEADYYCEKYFCHAHKLIVDVPWHPDNCASVCFECAKAIEEFTNEDSN